MASETRAWPMYQFRSGSTSGRAKFMPTKYTVETHGILCRNILNAFCSPRMDAKPNDFRNVRTICMQTSNVETTAKVNYQRIPQEKNLHEFLFGPGGNEVRDPQKLLIQINRAYHCVPTCLFLVSLYYSSLIIFLNRRELNNCIEC